MADMHFEISVRLTKCSMKANDLLKAAGIVKNEALFIKLINSHCFPCHMEAKCKPEFEQLLNFLRKEQGWTFDMEAHWAKVLETLVLV